MSETVTGSERTITCAAGMPIVRESPMSPRRRWLMKPTYWTGSEPWRLNWFCSVGSISPCCPGPPRVSPGITKKTMKVISVITTASRIAQSSRLITKACTAP